MATALVDAKSPWPDWLKGAITAAAGGLVAVFGMGLTEGARRAQLAEVCAAIPALAGRISALELARAADNAATDEFRRSLNAAMLELKTDIREIKTEIQRIK